MSSTVINNASLSGSGSSDIRARRNSQIAFLTALLYAALLVFPWLSVKPLHTRGEAREALVPLAMRNSGDWILPQRYGDEIATKPPMAHWMMALTAEVTGAVDEFSTRFPSALMSVLVTAALFSFCQRRNGWHQAALASLILNSSIEWHRAAMTSRVDMVLSAFLALGLIAFIQWQSEENAAYRWAAVFFFALATLSKGPVALVLPAIIISAFTLLKGNRPTRVISLAVQLFLPAGLIAASWYVAALIEGGSEFIDVVRSENLARFVGTIKEGKDPHSHSVFYLYGMLILGLMPFSILYFFGISWRLSALRDGFIRVKNSKDEVLLFSILVVVCTVGFYSIPASKRSVYLLPCYPFLAIITARFVEWVQETKPVAVRRFLLANLAVFTLVFLVLFAILIDAVDPSILSSREKKVTYFRGAIATTRGALIAFPWLSAILLLLPVVCALAIRQGRASKEDWQRWYFLGVFSILTWANAVLLPEWGNALNARHFAQTIDEVTHNAERIYAFRRQMFGIGFYLNNRVFDYHEKTFQEPHAYMLVHPDDYSMFKERFSRKYEFRNFWISERPFEKFTQRIMLVEIEAVRPAAEMVPEDAAADPSLTGSEPLR